LEQLIEPDWHVLEFGSGMSSFFFSRHCARLTSIEHDVEWHEKMRSGFERRGLSWIDYRLRDASRYTELDDIPDGSVDLVLIDGIHRERAAHVAIQKCRPGGWLLLDNSDIPNDDHQNARAAIVATAGSNTVEVYDDLYPFMILACQSILVQTLGSASQTLEGHAAK
jgi:predicted O-methyltransferase YrrM